MRPRITAKRARREGVNLDGRDKIARILAKRPYAPGVHGPTSRTRMTDYGKQLREKQKAKWVYGLNEKQFSNLFKEATKKRGDTGITLIKMLESRLDNVVFRAGFVKTRASARQAVGHAQFDVNGKKVNIPSYRVKSGDIISVRVSKRQKGLWKQLEESLKNRPASSWLTVDAQGLSIKVTGAPTDDELKQQPFDAKQIVEFYSR
jgi:small subunit ribosomal protein S4